VNIQMAIPITVTNFVRSPGRGTSVALASAVWQRGFGGSGLRNRPRVNRDPPGQVPPCEVVIYFAEDPRRIYQLEQWLPVLAELHRLHPVVIVVRKTETLREIRKRTPLPTVYVRRLPDLLELYEELDPAMAIYVNNGVANFQSLAHSRALHVHVNHGESDKVSMVSNQAKAYDRVFVAGEAARRRHRAALINLDERLLVEVGRPQLDLTFPPVLAETDRPAVIYAPTWEGENEYNNYTSLDCYGTQIVQAVIGQRVRLIYRPHPRVATSTRPEITAAHLNILEAIDRANTADPTASHEVAMSGSMLALFQHGDAMITDVSSAGLDYLYLRTGQPLFITDRRNDSAALAADAPISAACDVVNAATIGSLAETVAGRLQHDALAEHRRRMRRFYFGDLAAGESTRRFLAAAATVIADRNRMIDSLPRPGEGTPARTDPQVLSAAAAPGGAPEA
jgi:hypothetical protein